MVELDPRLVALAEQGGYRVTSSTGGRHNVGSLHGSGLAIDIDHRGVDFEDLQQRVAAVGGRVLDERTRPKGQAVWGGPHFHIELPKKAVGKAIEVGQLAKQIERPEINPRDYSMGELLDLTLTGKGFLVDKPDIKAVSVPTSEIKRPEAKQQVEADRQLQQLNAQVQERIAREAAQQAQPEELSTDVGILKELGAGLANPLTGYTRDVAASNLAGRPAYEIGQLAGNLGVFLGAGFAGGVPGTVAAGAGLSGGAELQRQRLAGEQTNVGKALGAGAIGGGLSALPVFQAARGFIPRTAANAAIQGGAEGVGSIIQQGVEQGTFTPNVDVGRTLTQAGIGASGGGIAGALGTRAPKLPERPLAPRQNLYAPRVELAPETLPVQPRTPSVRQTLELDNTIDLTPASPPRNEVVQTPTEPEVKPFDVPAEPVVRDVEYTAPKQKEKATEVEGEATQLSLIRQPKAPDSGVDAAFYDLGSNPADEAALKAAREALPGYGDENLRAIGQRVRQAYDELDGQDVIPGSIVKKAIAPEVPPGEGVQGFKPKPQTPEKVVMDGKRLRGGREMMIEQGTQGSVIKSKADFDNLVNYRKSLPTLGKNRMANLEELTPDVVTQRMREQLAMIESGELRTTTRLANNLRKSLAKMESGQVNARDFNTARNKVVDMDLRIEKQNVNDQIGQLHPSLREAFSLNYDEATGIGRQKASKALTLDEVAPYLTDNEYNLAKTLEVIAQNDGRIRLDVDTEITGATSRVGEKEISPIGFTKTKDNYVAVTGYNEDGHIAQYYITPKPNADGQFSKINRVLDAVNTPAFRGEYANIYKGVREFSIDDIMARPVREDGIRTSDALATAEKAGELASRADIMAANPKFAKLLDDFRRNPRAATVATVKDMEDLLKTDPKLLKKMCTLLGKVS